MKRFALTLCLCLSTLAAALPSPAEQIPDPAEQLLYLTEEDWPFNYSDKGRVTGLAVEVLRLTWKRMGVPEQPVHVYPWPRAYDMTRLDPLTMVFSMYRTKGRDPLFKWVGPIAEGKTEVYALRSRHLSVRSMGALGGYRVGAVKATASANILSESGIRYTASGKPERLVKMLRLGRLDALAIDSFQFHHFARRLGYSPGDFEAVRPLCVDALYYAFSPDTPEELLARFQTALDKVKGSPEYLRLVDYYLN